MLIMSHVFWVLQDFSVLRAKTYDKVTIVGNRKNYNCHFCDFMTPLFGTIKEHIRENHLEDAQPAGRRSCRRSLSAEDSVRIDDTDTPYPQTRSRSDESFLASAGEPKGGRRSSGAAARYHNYHATNFSNLRASYFLSVAPSPSGFSAGGKWAVFLRNVPRRCS
jgi:hypothetical protein